jgi:hypothetical protein
MTIFKYRTMVTRAVSDDRIRQPTQAAPFEEYRRRESTLPTVGWLVLLATLTAIVMGASLAFAT